MIIQNSHIDRKSHTCILQMGSIYVDLEDKKQTLYLLLTVNAEKQLCRFYSLKSQIVYYEIPYKDLQLRQVT